MGLVNRRNAVLGWTVWQVAKRGLKRKAKAAVPGGRGDSKRKSKRAIVSGIAALGGTLWFWRRTRSRSVPPA
jgi:hypothetical protein